MIPNILPLMQSIQSLNLWLRSLFCCLFIFCTFTVNSQPTEDEWQLVKHKENISIYSQPSDSGYIWIRASMEVNGTPTDMVDLLNNTAIASHWIDNCKKVEVLDMPSEDQRVVRTTFNAPWPIENRDMVTISTTNIHHDAQTIIILIRDYSSFYPPQKGIVRMQNVKGKWHIKAISKEAMSIEYSGYGEPSGNLPIWLANKLITSSIFKTFHNLRETLGSSSS
ncbi:START domain-containing protein [Aliiglaciecola lipolytica]|uniref:START domain-containing protein n=1 Tax=Aliiglaciecola lipolytica E3 TaxID=1127673 RepID=K6YBY1_9ALTE|nr:START domain-containing protein [Aliiglaciecola lipolytica]GAC14158.1 hypothetical protein GLIP_1524 [Aliiglaciecola lipolytica E3]